MPNAPINETAHRHLHRRQAARRHAQAHHWRFYKARDHWRFIASFARTPIRWKREPLVLLALALIVVALGFSVLPGWASQMKPVSLVSSSLVSTPLALPPSLTPPAPPPPEVVEWQRVRVRSGQTLGSIFAGLGLSPRDLARVMDSGPAAKRLKALRLDEVLQFRIPAPGQLAALQFGSGEDEQTRIAFADGAVTVEKIALPMSREIEVASGVIEDSLFGAGERAGLDDAMIMKLADILGYDIDFAQDLREGDRFSVVYDTVLRDGERVRTGDILAASFINGSHRYTALRFVDADGRVGYFDADGRPLKKAFLRTPVEFSRISSRFSAARMHPILGTMRAHRGVDYAAPQGTPVKSAGSGRIAFHGWQQGYGNCLIVDHGSGRTTLYGHLSGFAAGSAQGARVGQGDTIGYVGMTGLATAPHLHYEFRIGGVHRDPLTVELPKADPLVGVELAQFKTATKAWVANLGQLEQKALAAR